MNLPGKSIQPDAVDTGKNFRRGLVATLFY